MNAVPQKLRTKWKKEDLLGIKRVCLRSDERNCKGRLTKEHCITYAGKQLQEEWAILDICAYHHGVDQFQDCGDLNKEKHVWIALNRAPEGRLVELSKSEDKVALKQRLDAKYGVYSGPIISFSPKILYE